jgi:hypothetical protein
VVRAAAVALVCVAVSRTLAGPVAAAAAACRAAAVAVAAAVGSIAGVPAAPGSRRQDTAARRCNAPNFAVEFFLFFTRQNSGVTFPFSFSPR